MTPYRFLLHPHTYQKATDYLDGLNSGRLATGHYLRQNLQEFETNQISIEEFIEQIIRTKKPQIFAESAVHGDGSDWNQAELSILGDISIAVPVRAFDNGLHTKPVIHPVPIRATLLFTPGALLRNDTGSDAADWVEVTVNGKINSQAYYELYERRLLPIFIHANKVSESRNREALISIPGIGCGQFAGKFKGQLGIELKTVLYQLIQTYGDVFTNIKAVYYDPYQECDNERYEIGGTSLMVRPLKKGNGFKPQLCPPQAYGEEGDDFSACELFSIVAWDHVSWPGNDFFLGHRTTDDGVKAAATDSMFVLTGVEGDYDVVSNTYKPPKEYRNWEDVIFKLNLQLCVKGNLSVLPEWRT